MVSRWEKRTVEPVWEAGGDITQGWLLDVDRCANEASW